MTNQEINTTMEQINKDYAIVMDFLYKHVAPEQMIDEIEDEDLRAIWLKAITSAIEKFNEDYSTLTITDEDLSRLSISKEITSDEFV